MDNAASSLETLRQLREMLDAGTLTPAEFDALKAKLIFGPESVGGSPQAPPAPEHTPPPAGFSYAAAPPDINSLNPRAAEWPAMPASADAYGGAGAWPPATPTPFVAAEPLPLPTAARPDLYEEPADEYEPAGPPAPRSYLNLVLALGGLLALLAVVIYLNLNPRPSENLSSANRTAADTLDAPIEEGPQAVQPVREEAVPETIRVVPTNPAPPIVQAPSLVRDSLAGGAADTLP